jgi:hypothetical protein
MNGARIAVLSGGAAPPTPGKSFTYDQIVDVQTNLMIYIGDNPALKPVFSQQVAADVWYDPRYHLRSKGDNGATPNGVASGDWFWCVTLPLAPESLWPQLIGAAKKLGWTHWFLHVAQPPDDWYHAVYDTRGVNWGAQTMKAHAALLMNGIIPVWAGVSTAQGLAAGIDGSQALAAMTDWDDFDTADCQINAVAAALPKALIWWERPGPSMQVQPTPDACSTVVPNPGNGGAWLRSVQQRVPNFVGIVYEVNIWDGLQPCIDEITRCHPFYRDVIENRGETNTYALFWQGGDLAHYQQLDDQLQAACPWLKGYMSGGTAHPAPSGGGGTSGKLQPGDGFNFAAATQHRGPAFTGWPATTEITRLECRTNGVYVEFSKKDGPGRWPDIVPPGWDGALEYCLGLAMLIDGVWHVSAPIQFWNGLTVAGGNVGDPSVRDNGIAGTIHGDWFYSGEWGPLQRQPAHGEQIGFFVVAGNVRGVNDAVSVQERSNVVVVPFPDVNGAVFTR